MDVPVCEICKAEVGGKTATKERHLFLSWRSMTSVMGQPSQPTNKPALPYRFCVHNGSLNRGLVFIQVARVLVKKKRSSKRPIGKRNLLATSEQDSWLLRCKERRRPENASVRRWIGLGDKALRITGESRQRILTRQHAKDTVQRSKKLRLAVQETKRRARESRGRKPL